MKTNASDNNNNKIDISDKTEEKVKYKLHQYCFEESRIINDVELIASLNSSQTKKAFISDSFNTDTKALCSNYSYLEEIAKDILLLITSDKNKPNISVDANDIVMTFNLIAEKIMQDNISLVNNIDLAFRYENYINVKLDNLDYPNDMKKDKFYYIFNIFISLNMLIRIPVIQLNRRFSHDYKLYISTPVFLTDWYNLYSLNDNLCDILLKNIIVSQIYEIKNINQDLKMYSLIDNHTSVNIDLAIENIGKGEVHLIKFNDTLENNTKCFNNINVLKLFSNYNITVYDINTTNFIKTFKQLKAALTN